jgi:hypothetical protein
MSGVGCIHIETVLLLKKSKICPKMLLYLVVRVDKPFKLTTPLMMNVKELEILPPELQRNCYETIRGALLFSGIDVIISMKKNISAAGVEKTFTTWICEIGTVNSSLVHLLFSEEENKQYATMVYNAMLHIEKLKEDEL